MLRDTTTGNAWSVFKIAQVDIPGDSFEMSPTAQIVRDPTLANLPHYSQMVPGSERSLQGYMPLNIFEPLVESDLTLRVSTTFEKLDNHPFSPECCLSMAGAIAIACDGTFSVGYFPTGNLPGPVRWDIRPLRIIGPEQTPVTIDASNAVQIRHAYTAVTSMIDDKQGNPFLERVFFQFMRGTRMYPYASVQLLDFDASDFLSAERKLFASAYLFFENALSLDGVTERCVNSWNAIMPTEYSIAFDEISVVNWYRHQAVHNNASKAKPKIAQWAASRGFDFNDPHKQFEAQWEAMRLSGRIVRTVMRAIVSDPERFTNEFRTQLT